ncbi:MAG TPA: phosphate permease, partial [Wenzhouxiangella sp.]|nr:phosphate permease [Wenzhouxiangella sp.]
ILGVGLARGIAAINLQTVSSIFMSWIITIPAGALLSVIFFLIIRALAG